MRTKVSTKRVMRELKTVRLLDSRGNQIGEGIRVPDAHADDEIWCQIMDDTTLEEESSLLDASRLQFHIGGTRKAYEELGTILLTLSRMKTLSPYYRVQFDWKAIKSKGSAHIIIHVPVDEVKQRTPFPKVHTVAKAIFSKDGKLIKDLTPGRRPRKKS